jgi:hypothetical protein
LVKGRGIAENGNQPEKRHVAGIGLRAALCCRR